MKIPRPAFALLLLVSWSAASATAEVLNVYFGTGGGGAKGIYRATFDTDKGTLTKAQLAAEIGSPGFLALHPDGDKLYCVEKFSGGPGVAAFRIGRDGGLTLIDTSPTGDGSAAHIAVHPSGRFLLTAQYGGGSVALFPIETGGRLGAAKLSRHKGGSNVAGSRQASPHPHWCGFSPDGRYALVPDLGMDGIVIYRVDASVPAIQHTGFAASIPGGGPRHMRFSPDGRFIYLLNEIASVMTTFAWDATTGTARRLAKVPALTDAQRNGESFNAAAEILVHPSGRYVYFSNRGHDSVTVFRTDPATAAAEVIQVQPIRGAFPRNINLAPGAGWLLAAGADSNTVSVHQVDPQTGRLTYQRKGVINVPGPICILFGRKG